MKKATRKVAKPQAAAANGGNTWAIQEKALKELERGVSLLHKQSFAEALPHFLHPSEEIYPKIRDDLKTYSVAPFAAALKALAQTVKAKNPGAYRTALAGVEERLAQAGKGVRDKEQNWPSFVVETVLEVLGSAASEYEEAIQNGRIAKPVEYQDARGFVWQADKLFGG